MDFQVRFFLEQQLYFHLEGDATEQSGCRQGVQNDDCQLRYDGATCWLRFCKC